MSNDTEKVMLDYMSKSYLKQQVLDLTIEVAKLKDKIKHLGEYAETDGYEVGSASDYEDDRQLNFNFGRRAEDKVREQFNRECD